MTENILNYVTHKILLQFRTETATGRLTARTPARLTPGRARQVPNDNALRAVAEKIHRKDWPRVANKLALYSEDVDDIQRSYSGSTQQQVALIWLFFNSLPVSGEFCNLLITFANSFDPDQDRQIVGPDLDPNRLTL